MFNFNTEQTEQIYKLKVFTHRHTRAIKVPPGCLSSIHRPAFDQYVFVCTESLQLCPTAHSQLTYCNTEPLQLFPSGLRVRTKRSTENKLASRSSARFNLHQFKTLNHAADQSELWMKLYYISKNRRLTRETH